ncbi:hypothetical protein ONZ43_g1185 [Nemania bipapillata]|uniref:Uncharacterized protein n=1 Tax=Nemania bipapillata TaxID=110536 RepID=A0ACC2J5J8_9PEZI|nr:hypothetical protein ONZ43_g1185 [Nemania bipapillata]
MRPHFTLSWLCSSLLLAFSVAQTDTTVSTTGTTTPAPTLTDPTSSPSSDAAGSSTDTPSLGGSSGGTTTSSTSDPSGTTPPDVYLRVPELHVGRIELDVDDLSADINLAAQVASLVEINAGIQIGVTKVNITIADVDAELELIVRLGNLVEIVNRTLESLNLNPLLINVLDEVTDLVGAVVGEVDGLLGSIVNGDSTINLIIDNLGNIVQEVAGATGNLLSSIVGNYEQNMTYTGAQQILNGGLIQKTYSYSPLNALVNIVFNSVGQVVQAVVVKRTGGSSPTSSTTISGPTASFKR